MTKTFPIRLDPEITSIPWDAIQPHELQVLRNHFRGLETLAERGGLTPCEALAAIEGRAWEPMGFSDARRRLMDYVRGATGQPGAPNEEGGPPSLTLEDLVSAVHLVEAIRDGRQHATRWNLNRLQVTLERVKGRLE